MPARVISSAVLGRRLRGARAADWLRRQAGGGCDALGLPWGQAELASGLGWRAEARGEPLAGSLGRC